MNRSRILLAWGASCMMNFPTNYAQAYSDLSIDRNGDSVNISGQIPHDSWSVIESYLGGNVKKIITNSGGGDVDVSIKLANILRERNIDIEVRGICASSCAQYIFMAAPRRYIAENSLLIFHNHISSLVFIAELKQLRGYDEQALLSRKEMELIKNLNIDAEILYRPQMEIRTACIYERAVMGQNMLFYKSIFSGWIPEKDYLASIGVKIDGYWPKTADEVSGILEKIPPTVRPRLFLGGYSSKLKDGTIREVMENIKICDK